MDHGHMDHGGDMDMGGDQCSMNVRTMLHQFSHRLSNILIRSDAFHVVLEEPVHHFPTMARHRHLLTHHVACRNHPPDGWLRVGQRYEQKVRSKP